MMNGIDISSWQTGINLSAVPADFVIIKATEGTRFVESTFKNWANWCKNNNKCFGFFHFINNPEMGGSIKDQAKYFYNAVKDYIGYGIPFLDWENGESYSEILSLGPTVAKEWLDEFYRLSGKRAIIYMSQSVTFDYNWSNVAKDYKLWMAQYPNYNIQQGYLNNPWYTQPKYWDKFTILQYSGNGRLSGFNGGLDLDKAYLTKEEWNQLAKGNSSANNPSTDKSIEAIAQEVLDGKWGDGEDRYYRLRAAGYDYDAVQNKVNELIENPAPKIIYELKDNKTIAEEVLQAKWGNGADREKRLTAAGYDYDAIQEIVNQLVKERSKKTNEQIAAEVIQGKWGKYSEWQSKLEKEGYKYNDILSLVISSLLDSKIELIARQVLDGMWGNGQDREDKLKAAGYNYDVIQNKVNEILK